MSHGNRARSVSVKIPMSSPGHRSTLAANGNLTQFVEVALRDSMSPTETMLLHIAGSEWQRTGEGPSDSPCRNCSARAFVCLNGLLAPRPEDFQLLDTAFVGQRLKASDALKPSQHHFVALIHVMFASN
jgi:hypothetical protein